MKADETLAGRVDQPPYLRNIAELPPRAERIYELILRAPKLEVAAIAALSDFAFGSIGASAPNAIANFSAFG
jgi:hypothetical protein